MADITPGVRMGATKIRSAEEAADRIVVLASQAKAQGTFGVGGLLIDRTGHIIAEATNAVVSGDQVLDPTAHVERQLVDWHYHARREGFPIPADELTIVSSLDPCAMCAGAILRSGMRVVILAQDLYAGVHTRTLEPHLMPQELWSRAQRRMGFFGVSGRRQRAGDSIVSILNPDVSAGLLDSAGRIFADSLQQVKAKVGGAQLGPEIFNANKPVLTSIKELASRNRNLRSVAAPLNIRDERSRPAIMNMLASDGSVLIDPDGHVIIGAVGAEDNSLARTSVLELVRAYVAIRRTIPAELPHQRYCSIVKHRVPRDPAKALLELGAMGSFLEEPRLVKTLPAMGYLTKDNMDNAARFAQSLPQLYQDLGISVGHI
jgi:tRNA(Arg) A34 adenosine deaminase TadA